MSMEQFMDLSVILTGITLGKLAPPLDPQTIAQLYFDTAQQEAGQAFTDLLNLFGKLKNAGKTDQEIGAEIMADQTAVGNTARSIMAMWYLGSWYAPTASSVYGDPTQRVPHKVISANAYTRGWAWNVAQAHPMGFSQLRFGYWTSDPLPLSDFVGDV